MTRQVFEGLKVADFSWVGVGPQIGRELAEHGATVIRIESHRVPDSLRIFPPFRDGEPGVDRSAFGAAFNANKYSIALDLSKPKGLEAAKKLVGWADLVTESFTPGTMAKLGLDYDSCKKIKPDLIYFSTCQMGQKGPLNRFGAYGMFGTTYAGFAQLLGLPDREPLPIFNNYSDFISPWYLASTVIAALIRRRKTGKGIYLDQAQVEAGVTFLGPLMLDHVVNGSIPKRMGNRDPYMAPNGIYPCKSSDHWIAIAVSNDDEWHAFCKIIGKPDLASDDRFSTLQSRKENEDELDKLIEEWTGEYPREQIMEMMQNADVPCGIVQNAEDLLNDPQLKHREHFRFLEHSIIGRHVYNAPAYRLSKTPNHIHKAAPCLGEDNEWVYKEILGLSDDDIEEMLIEGVITTEMDLPGAMDE